MRGISRRACGLLSICFPYLFVEKLITNLNYKFEFLRHEMQPSKLRYHVKNFGYKRLLLKKTGCELT